MGAVESHAAGGEHQWEESGPLDIRSLGDYSQWWGAGIPGLGESADSGAGALPADGVEQAFALAADDAAGPRRSGQPRALDFSGVQAAPVVVDGPAHGRASDSVAPTEQDATAHAGQAAAEEAQESEEEEDEEDEEDEEEDDDDDEEAAEMSRLVGRDGYLLPFATNNFHMYQEAQLHRLHHQEPWLDKERAHGYDDRENIFFR